MTGCKLPAVKLVDYSFNSDDDESDSPLEISRSKRGFTSDNIHFYKG